MEGLQKISIKRSKGNLSLDLEDVVAIEEPLEIRIKSGENGEGKPISITMRTPGNDAALSVGFLFTEGIIQDYTQVKNVSVSENFTEVELDSQVNINQQQLDRNFYTTSSCGVCGKASIDAIKTVSCFNVSQAGNIEADKLYSLLEKMSTEQSLFTQTGGIHAAGLFTFSGEFVDMQEDVGRHNALDKIIGKAFQQNQLPLDNHVLLLSGRASFELIQKARMAGIGCVVAVGAPSSLAVEMAKENKMTLVGFLKKNGYNIYTGHERIKG